MAAIVQKLTPPPPLRSIEMNVSEWIMIQDNPRQRDTERHLRRATHLLKPHPAHARVAMAVDPKGNRWKIDGHTRALAWSRQMVTPPNVVFVDVYPVRDAAAAAELYIAFDNKAAVETAADQVSGAFHQFDWSPKSRLLSRNVLGNAVRLAAGLSEGQRRSIGPKEREIYPLVGDWLDEIRMLDDMNLTVRRFPGPLVTAALMTFRKRGQKARGFWQLYNDDAGQKIAEGMDPVEALSRFMLENRVVSGPIEMVGKALAAFEAHEDNRVITRGITARDASRYMVMAKKPGK